MSLATFSANDPAAPPACTLACGMAERMRLPQGLTHGGFRYWLARLQGAWYADEHAWAARAAAQALVLMGPGTPAIDRMRCHLFAALALTSPPHGAVVDGLRGHARALETLAARCPDAASAADLVRGLLDGHTGDGLAALRAFESAAGRARGQDRAWIAALAYECAAAEATTARLDSVALHFRRQALAGHARAGAGGRIGVLRRAWGETAPFAGAEPCLDDHAQRAGIAVELGAAIAHEVNQPLAAIVLNAAAARRWLRRGEPDIERALASLSLISTAGRQAGDVVRSVYRLVAHQEDDTAGVERVDVDAAVREVLDLMAGPLCRHGIDVELALDLHGCTVRGHRVQLQQVVTNLMQNAIEALAQGGGRTRRIGIATRRYNDGRIDIAVTDNGPGVASADRERIFGRLFSTKRGNTGLGLSISRDIARRHGGDLVFEPCEPHGARFCLRLPDSTSEAP